MLLDRLQEQIGTEHPRLLTSFTGDFQPSLQNWRKTRLVQVLAPNPLVARLRNGVPLIGMSSGSS